MVTISRMKRFEPHAHTEYSNIRLLDSISKPKNLIQRARDLGLSGIAITDHECLSHSIELSILQKEIHKEDPNFKIAIGNEIYLTNTRNKNQKYFHFILIAKNKLGHKMLSELSSKSWMQSYTDRGMERVPTLKSELKEIINKYGKGNLIATSACLGGELSTLALAKEKTILVNNKDLENQVDKLILDYIKYCKELFGNDFYIECAPGCSREQIATNKILKNISKQYGIAMVIGTDAHYLKKEDRYVHKAYLNSQDGQREVDDFYEYSYLQEEEEIYKHLFKSGFDKDFIFEMIMNSWLIYNKIENYSLLKNQQIPTAKIENDYQYEKLPNYLNSEKYPTLSLLEKSEDKYDRHWLSQCIKGMIDKKLEDKLEYWDRLEEEARVKKIVGSELGTNMLSYPTTLQHYINLFWECGSMVGAGRGSSCAALNHYLLDVTQLDPIKWDLPFFRYLNEERLELGEKSILPSCKKRV